jgi:hypothetical protein
MNYSGNTFFQDCKNEAEERWGDTDAYREYSARTCAYTAQDFDAINYGLDKIFGRFAACMRTGAPPESQEAGELVSALKSYITANLYNCTDEILSCLGFMYVSDERFSKYIDRHAIGTSAYVNKAIKAATAV